MEKVLTGALTRETQKIRHKFASNPGGVNLMFKLLHIGRIGCFLYQYVSLRYGGSIKASRASTFVPVFKVFARG